MRAFTDQEVIDLMNHHHECATTCGKQAGDTQRKAGDSGRVADEWMMWRREALKRGLVKL